MALRILVTLLSLSGAACRIQHVLQAATKDEALLHAKSQALQAQYDALKLKMEAMNTVSEAGSGDDLGHTGFGETHATSRAALEKELKALEKHCADCKAAEEEEIDKLTAAEAAQKEAAKAAIKAADMGAAQLKAKNGLADATSKHQAALQKIMAAANGFSTDLSGMTDPTGSLDLQNMATRSCDIGDTIKALKEEIDIAKGQKALINDGALEQAKDEYTAAKNNAEAADGEVLTAKKNRDATCSTKN